jgi:hypothetical protein
VPVPDLPASTRRAPKPGAVRVAKSGETLEPERERHRERLEQLWVAFCKRHPRFVDRFARRSTVMEELARQRSAGVERSSSEASRRFPQELEAPGAWGPCVRHAT